MGRQIPKSQFSDQEVSKFRNNLREETALLLKWIREDEFEKKQCSIGLELETWLVDKDFIPAPNNTEFLDQLDDPMIVPELSKFNAEINAKPRHATGASLSTLHRDLSETWKRAQKCAEGLGLKLLMIGTLPTLRDQMLGIEYMSEGDRYKALNEQIMFFRKGIPMKLSIEGRDQLESEHGDIMPEAAATSLQIHLQVGADRITDYFNASIRASAAVVAVAANSPYLFGKELWDETRIPIFEQAVRLPGFQDLSGQNIGRVSFGSDYVRDNLGELFLENLSGYPPILPLVSEDAPESLSHLRLHNGTIYRWNRPIVGVSDSAAPHLRIEHRTPAAGPTILDTISNIAFYVGLVHSLVQRKDDGQISFGEARENFYNAAREGLGARVNWGNERNVVLQNLVYNSFLSDARSGLLDLGVDENDVKKYLGVIQERVRSGQTGASWQRAFIAVNGPDFQSLTQKYFENQETGEPVHEWTV